MEGPEIATHRRKKCDARVCFKQARNATAASGNGRGNMPGDGDQKRPAMVEAGNVGEMSAKPWKRGAKPEQTGG